MSHEMARMAFGARRRSVIAGAALRGLKGIGRGAGRGTRAAKSRGRRRGKRGISRGVTIPKSMLQALIFTAIVKSISHS